MHCHIIYIIIYYIKIVYYLQPAFPNQHVPNSCCILKDKDAENPMPKNYTVCQKEALQLQNNGSVTDNPSFVQQGVCLYMKKY